MKVLILTKDTSIFSPESAAYEEILKCSERVDQLHVVVFNTKKDSHLFLKVSDKLFLHPTNSTSQIHILLDVFKIIRSQIFFKSKLLADLISAHNSFITILAAYLLARKYKRNYIIDMYENMFVGRTRARILDYVFNRASGVRVTSQIHGEIVSARNPLLEKRIFILPLLGIEKNTVKSTLEESSSVDIRKKYPQFNIILLTASKLISVRDLNKARSIMNRLHLRYPRIGLIVLSKIKNSLWHPFFVHSLPNYIVMEEGTAENLSFKNINVFIDIQSGNHEASALVYAIGAGFPVVAFDTTSSTSIIRDGENGFIANPSDSSLFAQKVMEILEIPGVRERIHLYHYDITDLYGQDPEDYYKRLIAIWNECRTTEADMRVQIHTTRAQYSTTDFYPAFTLDTVKKVFKKLEKNNQRKNVTHLTYSEQEEVFDVDSIKLGVEQALKEIAQDENFESKETENSTVDITI